MDVADWLRALGLERYEATFRENEVDAELLPTLAADDLREIRITSFSATGVSSWRQSPKLRMVKADRRFGTARRRCGVAAR